MEGAGRVKFEGAYGEDDASVEECRCVGVVAGERRQWRMKREARDARIVVAILEVRSFCLGLREGDRDGIQR